MKTQTNIVEPRPFYIIQHNPNTIDDVLHALANGANAIEPDINVYADRPDYLCMSHVQGGPSDPTLVEYLQGLHDVVLAHPELALVVFDCKEAVTTPERGVEILDAIRTYLTHDNTLPVILSVGKIDEGAMFENIHTTIRDREGLMIDEEGDPARVVEFFNRLGVTNQGHGNGISVMNATIGPLYRHSSEHACELRAEANVPKFIYTWSVNEADEMREYIRIGVDAVISDEVATLKDVVAEAEFSTLIRTARRDDKLFVPENLAYGLTVYTGDVLMAGTDANITFTLTGRLGEARKTVSAALIKRMERGYTNHVTIPSVDLGELLSIAVQHDNQGNAPGWYLDRILVRSHRYNVEGEARFDCWIESTDAVVRDLGSSRGPSS